MTLVLARGPSLTEQAAESIRSRIVRGVLQCGEPLSEMALAQELGVSKTPVREALIQLKREGLVDIHPQRGTFVFEMNAAQVRELGDMRAILETAALRLAERDEGEALCRAWTPLIGAMRAAIEARDAETYRVLDGAFHRAIVDAAGNRFLAEAYTGIAFRIQALRSRLSLDPALNKAALDDHVHLLELIRNKRSKRAADLLLSHIEGTRDRYIAILAGSGAGSGAGGLSGPAGKTG